MTNTHKPSEEEMQSPAFCWTHYVIENTTDEKGEQFHRCFECKHLFVKSSDLVDDHNNLIKNFIKRIPTDEPYLNGQIKTIDQIDEIFTCPHCIHDF